MKNFIKGLLLVALMLATIPLIPTLDSIIMQAFNKEKNPSLDDEDAVAAVSNGIREQIGEVRIYDETTKQSKTVAIEDFLTQAVLGSVSPEAEDELLKAQTVLMYTYILGKNEAGTAFADTKQNSDPEGEVNKYLHLVSKEEAREIYGEKADMYIEKVGAAVKACLGEYLCYDGKPIAVAYCFSSGGRTESAETVLGEDLPYLQPVECGYDRECFTEAVYTSEEVFARLSTQDLPITLLGKPEQWLVITEATDSGYVKEVTVDGSASISGSKLAELLELPSARFTLSYSEKYKRFSFEIYGAGHLMGLSQFGGNEMAKKGAKHKEILSYFFPGTSLESHCG